jgi:hypothetical protein
MKIEIKGIITHTSAPEPVGKNGDWLKMEIVIWQPEATNDFGEVYRKAQHFPLQIIKRERHEFPDRSKLLKAKVNAICYLNGFEYTSSNGLGWGINLKLKELQFIS